VLGGDGGGCDGSLARHRRQHHRYRRHPPKRTRSFWSKKIFTKKWKKYLTKKSLINYI
jgi:hypothetical protein